VKINFNKNGDMVIKYANNTERLALSSWIDTNILFIEDQISINMGALVIYEECFSEDLIDEVMKEKEVV